MQTTTTFPLQPVLRFPVLLLAVSCLLVLWLIYNSGIPADADQLNLITYNFRNGLPSADAALSPQLIVGFVNLFIPFDPIRTNAIVRVIGTALFLFSGALIATQVRWKYLFFALLLTSSFPFVWVTTDLFTASFLMIFVWGLLTNRSFAFISLFLTLFALARPDMLLTGGLLALYLIYRQPRRLRAALVLLAIIGIPYLITSQQSSVSDRAWLSICQHYAVLVAPPGASGDLNPWVNCPHYFEPVFGTSRSVFELIRDNFSAYLQFLGMSLQRSLANMTGTQLLALLLFIPIVVRLRTPKTKTLGIVTLLLLSNLVPVTALSFLHLRYQMRFYPILLLLLFAELDTRSNQQFDRITVRLLRAVFFLVLAVQIFQTLAVIPLSNWGD